MKEDGKAWKAMRYECVLCFPDFKKKLGRMRLEIIDALFFFGGGWGGGGWEILKDSYIFDYEEYIYIYI